MTLASPTPGEEAMASSPAGTGPTRSWKVHTLRGCTPTPLAFYLKALGILRLVAEQADPEARGAWRTEGFVLVTRLDREALESFFLRDYAPTPTISPWNKGAGFYAERDKGLSPIERSQARRLVPFRAGIAVARSLLKEISQADAAIRSLKEDAKALKDAKERSRLRADPDYRQRLAAAERRFKALKDSLTPACRRQWRGAHQWFLEAAVVLDEESKPQYPALLGTGGNDGRLDFANNQMQRLGDLFDLSDAEGSPRPGVDGLLQAALWGSPAANLMRGVAIGQYLPGGTGGANSTTGPTGDSLINPWDYVLMLEGAILFRAQATRRLTTGAKVQASAPFAVRGHAAGYAGASPTEKVDRGEQWMPLWDRPMALPELSQLLSEGRAQVGSRPAQRPLEALRAISRLGVARGLTGFERYAYLERNGQSKLAVPLGRIAVRAHPRSLLVDDLAPWMDRLHRAATYQTPAGASLLVESAQSMANRLELTCWDDQAQGPIQVLEGISHVRITRRGAFLTDTMLEAHRINSPYLLEQKDKTFLKQLKSELGTLEAGPIDRSACPATAPVGFHLPSLEVLSAALPEAIQACGEAMATHEVPFEDALKKGKEARDENAVTPGD